MTNPEPAGRLERAVSCHRIPSPDLGAVKSALAGRQHRRGMYIWTSEMDAELTRLRHERFASSEIADYITDKFGIYLTRNAVIGRALRLGLPHLPRNGGRHPSVTTSRAKVRRPRTHALGRKAKPKHKRIEWAHDIGSMRLLSLFDLADRDCRWPARGEGRTTLFCGLPAERGLPYCGGHCRVAYRVDAAA